MSRATAERAVRVGVTARALRDDNLRGFNRYTFNLIRALQHRDDIALRLYTDPRSPVHPAYREHLAAEVVELDAPRIVIWDQLALPHAAHRDAIDVLHVPTDYGLPWCARVPLVFTYHSATDVGLRHMIAAGNLRGRFSDFFEAADATGIAARLRQWRHKMSRWLSLRRADRVITVSEFAAEELVKLLQVSRQKIRVIYEAPDNSFLPTLCPGALSDVRKKFNIERPYILFVSGFDRHKNVSTLLQMYAELRQTVSAYALVLVGTGGNVQRVRTDARSLGLVENRDVYILERIHDELPALYQAATMFVTLAWRESFCFPLVEAMASGTPIVASRFGAIPEIAGDAVALVDPGNIGEVVNTVAALLRRPEQRKELAARGRQRVSDFSWDKTAASTVAVYREVIPG
ncbi:MAG: glycosyltransferase family 4 protein [Chloroflexi bacterium]|nr:glycosyltransferase family 4 protein [Chloroflexota bacterium]